MKMEEGKEVQVEVKVKRSRLREYVEVVKVAFENNTNSKTKVVLVGVGKNLGKTITVAEIIKRWDGSLFQMNSIRFVTTEKKEENQCRNGELEGEKEELDFQSISKKEESVPSIQIMLTNFAPESETNKHFYLQAKTNQQTSFAKEQGEDKKRKAEQMIEIEDKQNKQPRF